MSSSGRSASEKAQRAAAVNPAAYRRAVEAHVDRVERMHKIVEALAVRLSLRGGEEAKFHAMEYHLAEAKNMLQAVEVGK